MTWLSVASDEHGLPIRAGLGIAEELSSEALSAMAREWVPGPLMVMPSDAPRRIVWVVKQGGGGQVRVLAERHRAIPRPDGTELRLYDGDEATERRVATFRAGSWHWCVAEAALDPKPGEK